MSYMGLAWGVPEAPEAMIERGEYHDSWTDAAGDLLYEQVRYIHHGNDGRTWVGTFVCSSGLRDHDDTQFEFGAFDASTLPGTFAKGIAAARHRWEAFRAKARAAGIEVPEGHLMLVSDFY